MKKIIALGIILLFFLNIFTVAGAINMNSSIDNFGIASLDDDTKIKYEEYGDYSKVVYNKLEGATLFGGPDLVFTEFKCGWGYKYLDGYFDGYGLVIEWEFCNVGETYDNNGREINLYVGFYADNDPAPFYQDYCEQLVGDPTVFLNMQSFGGGFFTQLNNRPNSIRAVIDITDSVPESNEDNEQIIQEIPDCPIIEGTVYKKIGDSLEPIYDALITCGIGTFSDGNGKYNLIVIPKEPFTSRHSYNIRVSTPEFYMLKETNSILPGEQTTLDFFASNSPATPETISGENRLKVGETYTYSTSTVDPDGDKIFYRWSWGDGANSEWLGPYESGEICEASHSWDEPLFGSISVLVKDEDGNVNLDRAYLNIIVRKNKVRSNLLLNTILERIFPNHPTLLQILQQLLNF